MLRRLFFKPRLKLLHKGLLLVLAPLAIECLFVLTLWHWLDTADQQTRRLAHSRRVTAELGELERLIYDQARFTLFCTIDNGPENARRFLHSSDEIVSQSDLLDVLCAESAPEHEAYGRVKAELQGMMLTSERPLRMGDRVLQRLDITSPAWHDLLKRSMPQLKDAASDLFQIEARTQGQDDLSERNGKRALRVWIGVCLAAHLVLSVSIAVYFYKNLLVRLSALIQNANRLASGKPLLPPLRGDDEIDQYDAAFHRTAEELSAAAEYKRQMIAIVSHELRTPLTSIHGSLTLLSAGALGGLSNSQQAATLQLEDTSNKLIERINELLDKEKSQNESLQ